MAKYIIDLPENTHWIQWILESAEDHHPYMDYKTMEDLTPYTEPDLEQVRKEAYEQGQEDLRKSCVPKDEEAYGIGYNEGFQCGLDLAWEAARKIIHMPEGDLLDIFTECYSAVCTALQAILKYDASEVIEKLKAYEQEQEEIKVGDEVIYNGRRCVVIAPETTEKYGSVVDAEGGRHGFENGEVEKTGRTFPEIAAVLEKMREGQE